MLPERPDGEQIPADQQGKYHSGGLAFVTAHHRRHQGDAQHSHPAETAFAQSHRKRSENCQKPLLRGEMKKIHRMAPLIDRDSR